MDSGASRVVELTFTYPETAAKLREKQQAVTDSLRAASVYVRYREKETDKAELLLSYLTERFAYTQKQTDTPVYSLLCEGYATSQSMAQSWQLLCDQVNIECVTVAGSRQGANYWWNIVKLDDRYYHVDILSDVLAGSVLHLRSDGEMKDYYWDTGKYPACPGTTAAAPETQPDAQPADAGADTGETAGTAGTAEPAEPQTPAETPAEGTGAEEGTAAGN